MRPQAAPAARPKRQTQSSRAAARKRRSRRRTYVFVGGVVLLLIAAIVVPRILSSRADRAFDKLARPAGCGDIQNTGDSGAGQHLGEGERTTYDSLPPSHGEHSPTTLPAGVYEALSDEPTEDATIYKAVHSLEHGAVIVWHKGLDEDELDDLTGAYETEEKVLVVDYPDLPGRGNKIGLTAWGRSVSCEEVSTDVIDAFIDRFRGARTAPEPNNPI